MIPWYTHALIPTHMQREYNNWRECSFVLFQVYKNMERLEKKAIKEGERRVITSPAINKKQEEGE